jgi:hypothetical protein
MPDPNDTQPAAGAEAPKNVPSKSEKAPTAKQLQDMRASAKVLRTPAEWAKELGHIQERDKRLPQSRTFSKWNYAAADKLYGWSEYAYHHQAVEERFAIDEATFKAALEAAAMFPTVAPHAAALPPGHAERFKDFEPRASTRPAAAEQGEG